MRARMALKIAKIDYEHREILLRDKPKELLDISPKGTVPVLVLDDGHVLDESLDIMIWALGDFELGLVSIFDTEFKANLDLYKYKNRLESRDICEKFLKILDIKIKLKQITYFESLAISPFVRQFSKVDISYFDNLRFENLNNWLQEFINSELFKNIMQKHELFVSDTK